MFSLYFHCLGLAFLCVSHGANIQGINSTLRTHFSSSRHHVSNNQYKAAALEFIKSYMENTLKLDVKLDTFDTLQSNVQGTNVIGILKGKNYGTAEDLIYGIGAHYDTMRNTSGVNDNGSGIAIMLDAAQSIVKDSNRKNTVFFVAFDFEEWENSAVTDIACGNIGCGSLHFINTYIPDFIQSLPATPQFGGIYIMDTMMNFDNADNSQTLPREAKQLFPKQYNSINSDGLEGDFTAAIGRLDDKPLLAEFHSGWSMLGFSSAEIEVFTLPFSGLITHQYETEFGDFLRSDHGNFWRSNFRAVFLTDTANFRGYMKACYHQLCDNSKKITPENLKFMGKISDALTQAINKLTYIDSTSDGANFNGEGVLRNCIIGTLIVIARKMTST